MSTIVRFDPFRELDRLQNEVNRLFEGYQGNPGDGRESQPGNLPAFTARTWSPAVDVSENATEITLRADLPGIKQEDMQIDLAGDTLTIRGERKHETKSTADNVVRVERSYGRFQRTFTLGVPVEVDRVTAAYADGVLEIRLPKSEVNRPRRVQVTLADAAKAVEMPQAPQQS